jgi:dihydrofolate synthase/folylpolyglutamate synthase
MPSRLADWLERIDQRHSGGIELGLERCAEVWARMGRPAPARRVITVAGTNGKGSTVAGIESGLLSLGHRVGAYTSPHLIRYNERVRVDGADLGDAALIEGFEAVEGALHETRLTWFEFTTLAAFASMARASLDFAVLEVGLGGRLDAVNLIDPDLAVITPIGLDHQEYLGNDRDSVGREKAGVMRQGGTVVLGDRDPPLSVFDAAEQREARLIRIGADFDVSSAPEEQQADQWQYFFADISATLPIAMRGAHQADNLATALTAVLIIAPDAQHKMEVVALAIGGRRVRGRLECVGTAPGVLVDVGHNPMAAQIIRKLLEKEGRAPLPAVLGMLSDKDAEGFGVALQDRVSQWHCAGLGGPRGQSGEALSQRLRRALPSASIHCHENVAEALVAARKAAGPDGLVLACGSFHTAGEAISHIEGLN